MEHNTPVLGVMMGGQQLPPAVGLSADGTAEVADALPVGRAASSLIHLLSGLELEKNIKNRRRLYGVYLRRWHPFTACSVYIIVWNMLFFPMTRLISKKSHKTIAS